LPSHVAERCVMSEVYPSDDDLVALLEEVETGVEYIPTGTAPYYIHFRKLIYRLLLAAKRANDLRLYDEGALLFGVKAGKFWIGQIAIEYAGSSGNTFADNKANIYVYLDSSGTLVLDEYSAFPDMAVSKHVRLAVVTTLGGDITSIVDARDYHSVTLPESIFDTIEAHAADDTLTVGESGSLHTNQGATEIITLTLPSSAPAGTRFSFAVQAAYALRIDPGAGAILDDSGVTADKYKYCDTIGVCITLVSDGSGDWIPIGKYGTWLEEA